MNTTASQTTAFTPFVDELCVLVDHSNVHHIWRSRSLSDLVDRLVSLIGPVLDPSIRRVRVRLYGGWFEEENVSRDAQILAPQIAADFPKPYPRAAAADPPIVARVELATSLLCHPSALLTHTYVRRERAMALYCKDPPFDSCADPSACPLRDVHAFMSNKRCRTASCVVAPDDVIRRAEQKLADTMMVADMCTLAVGKARPIVLLSDDNDAWAGIFLALAHGATVVHIQSRLASKVSEAYKKLAGGNYSEFRL